MIQSKQNKQKLIYTIILSNNYNLHIVVVALDKMSSFIGDNITTFSIHIKHIIYTRIKQEKRIQQIRHNNGLSRNYTLSCDSDGNRKSSPLQKITNAADIAPLTHVLQEQSKQSTQNSQYLEMLLKILEGQRQNKR